MGTELEYTASFGYWMRRRRKALDLTQKALALQVGCAPVTIKKIEADERRPSRQMAERLADCLGIPSEQRTRFIRSARGELAIDRLPNEVKHTLRVAAVIGRQFSVKVLDDVLREG